MLAIYRREMRAYFTTPIGYIFAAVFLAVSAAVFCYTTLYQLSADMTTYFTVMVFALVVLLPLLTMKTYSEERRARTEPLLLSAPVSLFGIVFAKFLAAFTVYAAALLLTSLNTIILYAHGRPETATVIGSYFALLLLGAAFLSIGVFFSVCTESQLAAAVSTVAVLLFLMVIGFANALISVPFIRVLLSGISVFSRYGNFMRGIFDPAALIYYLSLCALFLFLSVRVLSRRRGE